MNLSGDYATIFNNLLLGETPPVEVRCAGFACVSFLCRGDMAVVALGRAWLNSMSVSDWCDGACFPETRLLCVLLHTGSTLGEQGRGGELGFSAAENLRRCVVIA